MKHRWLTIAAAGLWLALAPSVRADAQAEGQALADKAIKAVGGEAKQKPHRRQAVGLENRFGSTYAPTAALLRSRAFSESRRFRMFMTGAA